jgi:hypothetical protein
LFALRALHEWVDAPGELITWDPSPATLGKARKAAQSPVPPSYQQAQHVRAYREHEACGKRMERLTVPAWNIPGRCDVRAMTHVINAYLRRHDTYRSWFEFADDDSVVRRTLRSQRDIAFVPTAHGEQTSTVWREHILDTPSPLQWACFRFGVIQRAEHFTFYMSVDHVHVDAMFMGLALVEIHLMYAALVTGAPPIPLPPAGSYDEYCARQHQFTSSLTLDSPLVRRWIQFAQDNNGTLPRFELPLGDADVGCDGDLVTVELMDEIQSNQFESACTDAGARFLGGVFAAAALASFELTGVHNYCAITPTSTRGTQAEMMTTGWFTGTVPISIPVTATSFGATAREAQKSFDEGLDLAHVPFDRVLELATDEHGLRAAEPGVPMISYLDATVGPLSPGVITEWNRLEGAIYSEMGAAHQIGMWVNRFGDGTTMTVAFPNNPVARESMIAYIDAMKSVFVRVAAGNGERQPSAELVGLGVRLA